METLPIPTGTNVRDLVFKTLWTVALVAALSGLGYATNLDNPPWWLTGALVAATPIVAWLRQKIGATPPSLPAVGPVGESLPDSLTGPPPASVVR